MFDLISDSILMIKKIEVESNMIIKETCNLFKNYFVTNGAFPKKKLYTFYNFFLSF